MQLSWYSAKVRPYLRYRRLLFDERTPTFREYNVEIKRRVGHAVVPVVITPEGEWLQDSSVILERLDQRLPAEPIIPATPRQRFASYLLELWADEFWLPAGVHARWSFPENYPKWRDELSSAFAPGWPRVLQRVFPLTLRQFMRRVNLQVGATPEQRPLIERWMDRQLDELERHFAVHRWVFGQRPSLADFSLAGPLCGHLCYDEASCERWIRPRPHLHAWSQRMWTGVPEAAGPYLADDAIPETLKPALVRSRAMTPTSGGGADPPRKTPRGSAAFVGRCRHGADWRCRASGYRQPVRSGAGRAARHVVVNCRCEHRRSTACLCACKRWQACRRRLNRMRAAILRCRYQVRVLANRCGMIVSRYFRARFPTASGMSPQIFGGGTGASLVGGWARHLQEQYAEPVPTSTLDTVLGSRLSGRQVLCARRIEGAERLMLRRGVVVSGAATEAGLDGRDFRCGIPAAGTAINPQLDFDFQVFWDRGYVAWTAGPAASPCGARRGRAHRADRREQSGHTQFPVHRARQDGRRT